MFNKLRFRFILVAMLSVLLVLGTIILGINIISYNRTVKNADNILKLLAENEGRFPQFGLNENMPPEEGGQMPEPPGARDGFEGIRSPELEYESRFFSVLISSSGEVISADTGMIAAVDSSAAGEYALDVYSSGKAKGFVSDYRFLRSEEPDGVRIIFYDCGRSLDSFRVFLGASLAISAAGLVVTFILIFFASGRIVRPIATSYDKQKRFITDAGHEIKTPLAIINADCDVILSDGENTWAEDIKAQSKRLTELTNNLIYLAKMEEGAPASDLTETDLSRITEETLDSFASMFITQGKTLNRSIEPSIMLTGDPKALKELTVILLDNALKYSPEGGVTDVILKRSKKSVKLIVTNDTSVPVSPSDAEHLTDRFYRTDRSRNSETGGHGIGLSIASAICSAHQGKITAEPSENKLSMRVTLPVKTA